VGNDPGNQNRAIPDNPRPLPPGAWARRNAGLEFDRVLFFTDAVFAIALTLLVVEIGRPVLTGDVNSPAAMLRTLNDYVPEFIGFFVAFILIARYWVAHHFAFAQYRALDGGLIMINLVYLAFVAFLPLPSSLVGSYESNPISVVVFGATLACISGLEVVQFRHAYRRDLLSKDVPVEVYRWMVIGSISPVFVFILTMPLAFVSSTLCLASWMLTWPLGVWLDRRAPEGAEDFRLGGSAPDDPSAPT
jgi:uncharacterized membrane protein